MTTTDLSKSQLATVLSALDERPRNPANRAEALKAIGKSAGRFGLSAEDVLAAAPGLLDGRLSPAEFRAELQEPADCATAEPAPAGTEAHQPAPAGEQLAALETARAPAQAPQDGHDDHDAATPPARRRRSPRLRRPRPPGRARGRPGPPAAPGGASAR